MSKPIKDPKLTPFDFIKMSAPPKKPKRQIDSEKVVERKFGERCKAVGYWAVKFHPTVIGLPDRIVFKPNGTIFFVELKTTGKKPTLAQLNIHSKFRQLGFNVYVVDTVAGIQDVLDKEQSLC